jgi:FlaA1/EpsC-like NDP-sugar epimerase
VGTPRKTGAEASEGAKTDMPRFRNRYLFFLDAVQLIASPFVFYTLRFEGLDWWDRHLSVALTYTGVVLPTSLGIFIAFGMYRRLWRYASIAEVELIFVASVTAFFVNFAIGAVVLPELGITHVRVPLSVLVGSGILNCGAIAVPRLFLRRRVSPLRRVSDGAGKRTLIVGAGAAGQMILKELWANPGLGLRPVGFTDDDSTKQGFDIGGLPIMGRIVDLPEILRAANIKHVIVAMPRAAGFVVRQVVKAALDAGATTQTVPALSEIISGRVRVNELRNVEIQDLLRREPINTDLAKVSTLVAERTVLVTGAGGSIGGELCRQIASLAPAKLVLLGHGENSIFEILHEMRPRFADLNIVAIIADTRDRQRIFEVFDRHRPFSVFHAAAHKHVPLMEENVIEAITNNVVGTRNVVDASLEVGSSHFVFVSTDKAVRPTNVMGASKRVAEYVVRDAALNSGRNFVAVRFGNVLGSRGSVVPTFVRQISEGGPVTVTHPEMQRYFMTIPEAVQLVLQAGALGRGGELFMLDMGDPVKIVDLARDLIRLSGLQEGSDIEIQFTGVRAGEKLFEEMFWSDEQAAHTEHPKVLRATNEGLRPEVIERVADLCHAAERGAGDDELRMLLSQVVPDFDPSIPATLITPGFGVRAVPNEARPALRSNPGYQPPKRRPSGPMRAV